MSSSLFTSVFSGNLGDTSVVIGIVPIKQKRSPVIETSALVIISDEAKKRLSFQNTRPGHVRLDLPGALRALELSAAGGVFKEDRLRRVLDFAHTPHLELVPTRVSTVLMVKTAREAYQLCLIGCPKTDELVVFGKGIAAAELIGTFGAPMKPMGELTIRNYFVREVRNLEIEHAHMERRVPSGASALAASM